VANSQQQFQQWGWFGILVLACTASAQTPAFEVASVKASEPITPAMVQSGRVQIGASIDANNVRLTKFSLFDLVALAYQVKGHQVSGPTWMVTERYDIQAKLPEGSQRKQVPAMLQTLLAERFGMRIHRETREFDVYALVVAKSGAKLKASPAGEEKDAAPAGQLRGGTGVAPDGTMTSVNPGGDTRITPGPNGNLHVETKKMTLAGLASFIARYMEKPVMDMTGLAGIYDMEFDVSGEEMRAGARAHGVMVKEPENAAPDPSGVSLMSSIQKLGLKIEARRAPAEVIVIDKVEKIPTAN
jgi:uncharacterized protein (TIGR03435 family)